jgi:hypothetical protein
VTARLFTVFVEARDDYVYLFANLNAVILNGTVVTQFFIYWNSGDKEEKKD